MTEPGYAGEALGLPRTGPGSVAGYGRRIAGYLLDGAVAYLAALLAGPPGSPRFQLAYLGLFAAEVGLLTALTGASIGMRLTGTAVVRLDGRPLGFARAGVRTLLLLAVLPPVVYDRDRRGMHDRAVAAAHLRT